MAGRNKAELADYRKIKRVKDLEKELGDIEKAIKHYEEEQSIDIKYMEKTENEYKVEAITRRVLAEMERLGSIERSNPEGGIVRKSFINAVDKAIYKCLKDQVISMRAMWKANNFELKVPTKKKKPATTPSK